MPSCNVCGSPDQACGGHAADLAAGRAVTIPEEVSYPMRAEVIARATIRGIETKLRTTRAEAEANGWEIVGDFTPTPSARHKARTVAAAPVDHPEPSPAVPDVDALTYLDRDALYELAKAANIRGRSNMTRDELEAAVRSARG